MEDWDAAKGLGRRIFRLYFPINKYLGRILFPENLLKECLSISVLWLHETVRQVSTLHKGTQ